MKIKLQDTPFKHTLNKDARTESFLYRMSEASIGWRAEDENEVGSDQMLLG